MPNISAVLTAASITGTISAIRFDGYSIFLERDGNTNRLVARKGTDIQTLEWHDGERGLPGTDGVGITNVRKLGDSLEITMSDGHKYIIPNVRGANGMPGVPGRDGYTPIKGVDYFDGEPGYTPIKGVDYFDGRDGIDGKDGRDGKDGKNAEVTADNITAALGYTPADAADLRSTLTPVYTDGKGRYLNPDGRIYTASKYATCDFIAVVPGMRLHLEGFRADAQRAVCAYNRAQELVKVIAVGQPVGYVIDEVLPDDAYFIRACTDYDTATGEVVGVITGYLYGNIAELVVRHDAEIAAKQDTLVSGQTIKTINGGSLIGNGDIIIPKIVWCGYGTTTYDEISVMVANGYIPAVITNNPYGVPTVYIYSVMDGQAHLFGGTNCINTLFIVKVNTANVWTTSMNVMQIASTRDSVITSSASNSHYPSSKAVYDYAEPKQKDFVLIDDFTPQSDMTNFEKKVCPDGTPYAFDEVIITVSRPTGIAHTNYNSVTMWDKNGRRCRNELGRIPDAGTATRMAILYLEKHGNLAISNRWSFAGVNDNAVQSAQVGSNPLIDGTTTNDKSFTVGFSTITTIVFDKAYAGQRYVIYAR